MNPVTLYFENKKGTLCATLPNEARLALSSAVYCISCFKHKKHGLLFYDVNKHHMQTPKENSPVRKSTYSVFPVKQRQTTIDKETIDRLLTNREKASCYQSVKEMFPDVLSYLVDITPDVLRDICTIYRFPHQPYSGGLTGRTILVHRNEVFFLGSALGGHGVTEIAHIKQNDSDVLYFIYSWGSGICRSQIGRFCFATKQLFTLEHPILQSRDICFCLSSNAERLSVCQATITKAAPSGTSVQINKGAVLYKDINQLDFTVVEAGESE